MLEGQQNSGSNSGAQMHRALIAAVLGLLLLLVSFAGAAVAGGEPTADSPGPLVASTPTSQSELDALLNGGQPGATDPQTDPNAADDLPHSDLNRAEAEELLVSVFPTVTEDAAGIFSDLQIESFHSDYAAVVPPPSAGESAGLLTSTLPLRAETADGTKRVVDLSLDQTAEGRLRPENPIVDVTLPAEVDDQFRLPEAEVGIELVGPPEDRAASVIEGEAAFYPNVADDTDLLVTPTPTGFETFTQLRSSSAPLIHRFRLSVPQGAALVASDDGGATVLKGGDPLVVVKPPTAFDAAGEPVPVTLHVDANMVELEANPAPDAAYPILVDPLWENYSWKDTNSNAGIGTDWRSYVTPNQSLFTANWVGVLSEKPYAGLALRSYPGSISPGTSSNFNYYVPRYFTDATRPTTFIRNMKLSQVYYVVEENPSAGQPYVISGIWDEKNGIFHSSKTRYATEGAWSNVSLEFPNTQENTGVKNGGIALASYNSAAFKRQVFVGQASVEITENEPPAWGYLPNPGIWTHNSSATAPLDYAVSDAGLGISYVKVTRPEASGGSKDVWTSYQCAGSASNPCPATAETATRAITYDPGAMAQGESTLSVVAQDPVGNQSAPKLVKVKVDHDKPTADLSGNLTEQSSVGTKLAKYTLNYTAKDGDDAAAAALVPVGTVGTGTGQIERPFGIDADNAGNIWISDTTNNRVVELDKNGAYVRQITSAGGVPLKEVRGLTVAPNGSIFLAEKGNRRIIKFDSAGQFVSAFSPGLGATPFDVAVSADGTLWMTDPDTKLIYRYSETGTLKSFFAVPQPYGGVALPFGIDVDEFGNGWVALQGSNQIMEFGPSGTQLFTFGTTGSASGQFNSPFDVAIAPSGNLFVSDSLNHRIQEFKPDGTSLRSFGSEGPAVNQLNTPKNIGVAPDNRLLIADFGNKRVARWEHADQDPQSGVVKVQIKVDGTVKMTNAPGCAAGKNCSLSGSWTLNADEYTVGAHKVEVLATDGVNLVGERVLNVETHGDLTAPTVALSGSITEQATLGKTLPSYKVKVAATDPGPAEERKSGVASIVIKVDGTTVDSTSPGCPSEGCSLNREWTLNSSSKSPGLHSMEVIVSDAAGKTKSAVQSFEIKRDETAPELKLSGALAEAPEGWVQDGTRSLTTDATDAGGYGVKQTRFQIDGQTVGESLTQTCELGGCPKSKTFWIDMTVFGGGAHQGVAIAEDLAGNIRKKTWTINIDPLGHITYSEVADTVEAVEETAPEVVELSPVAAITSAKVGEGGADPRLTVSGGQIVGINNSTPTTISVNPAQGFAVTTESNSSAGVHHEETIGISPVGVSSEAGSAQIVNGSAAVVANQVPHVDAVMRPIYNGLMSFQDIRDAAAPETYSWQVKMGSEEELKLISPTYAGIFWTDGTQAMLIEAQAAHAADGQNVSTTLSVSEGNVITLTVHHRVAGTVYPVTTGLGWQGGIITEEPIVTEPEEFPYTFETETMIFEDPPPEVYPESATEPSSGASSSSVPAAEPITKLLKKFGAHQCEKDTYPIPPIHGCSIWEQKLKGFFWYNYKKVWETRQPKCPNDGSPQVEVNNPSVCEWVGPLEQQYGGGHHITAQALYDVTYLKFADTKEKHLSVYAYGSGYWNDHNTDCVCNPLPTD